MPYKDPNHYDFVTWLINNSVIIFAFFLSMVISLLRTIKEGKADWVEAGICGSLTVASYSLLTQFKLDLQVVVFIGGFIGWFGTNYTKKYVELVLMTLAKKFGVMPKESCNLKNEEGSKNGD